MNKDYLDQLGELALGSRLKRMSDRMLSDAASVYQHFNLDIQPKWFGLLALLYDQQQASVVEAALLPRLIGWGKTSRLLYTGESISAATAMQWGLLEEVVQPELLEQSTHSICQKICTAGANAIRLQKQLISQWETGSLKESIEAGIDTFVEAYKTNEPEIKMAAFFNQKSSKNA